MIMPVAVLCGRRDPLHAGFFVMGGFFADGVNGTPAFAFQTLDALVLQTMGMDIVGSCPVGDGFRHSSSPGRRYSMPNSPQASIGLIRWTARTFLPLPGKQCF
jgi:hypothetical protein